MAPTYRTASEGAPLRGKILAIIDALILAVWIGALLAFASIFAPAAFRIVPQIDVFAALTTTILERLTVLGYICGASIIAICVSRSLGAADRTLDLSRAVLVAVMLVLVAYESRVIIPEMRVTMSAIHGPIDSVPKNDARRSAYNALHRRSSLFYGTVVLLGFVTIALGTIRRID